MERKFFRSLVQSRVISEELIKEMEDMARFRNLLVHLYWEIDDERIYDEMGERIETLDRFVKEILMLLEREERRKKWKVKKSLPLPSL